MWAKRLKNDLFLRYSSRLLKQHAKFNSLYFFTSWFAFVLSLQIYFKLWSRTDSLDISLMLSCRTIELCFIFLLFSSLYYFIFFYDSSHIYIRTAVSPCGSDKSTRTWDCQVLFIGGSSSKSKKSQGKHLLFSSFFSSQLLKRICRCIAKKYPTIIRVFCREW